MKHILHRYIPGHFQSPLSLARRLFQTGDGAAIQAMWFAGLGVVASPFDLILQRFERRLLDDVPPSAPRPLVLVCGPPRSGTTVVFQTLVSRLPLAYFSNVAAIFPRSPLIVTKWLGLANQAPPEDFSSFYGKTRGLRGTCDALAIWDKWFGSDRMRPAMPISATQAVHMQRFFMAAEQVFGRALCCKNNSLNLLASVVGEHLPQAVFVCMRRDPVKLASSLYRARMEIHGDLAKPYGLTAASVNGDYSDPIDPAESIIEQVRFYETTAASQLKQLGPERFWVTPYEEFCRSSDSLLKRVADAVGVERLGATLTTPTVLSPPHRKEIPAEILDRFLAAFRTAI